ncbi:phage terminase small subunit [Burkholderia pseudomallei]|uniref:phage terminase small subunit n=1 Tax=Burkholderia pseudomallei TaxID=28450 RepID=UPI000537B3F1|nr:terminase endonuclease subunit [Burkholderia pseudomallei]KGV62138.1 phage small terminase subunit [Burkholderia pseudomallei ABCPW 91]
MTINTPARAHFNRVSAARAAAAASPGATMKGATAYELMLAKLAADRRALKGIQSIERKIELKRKLLPDYADYVAGVLSGGRGAQDDVLVTVMVWRIDAGDFDGALAIAAYALSNGLTLPDQFERSLASLVAEQFADAALSSFLDGETFDAASLELVDDLTREADMHDQVRAKLYKALGYATQAAAPARALDYLRRAVALNDRVGVKKDIDRLTKQVEAASRRGDGTDGT